MSALATDKFFGPDEAGECARLVHYLLAHLGLPAADGKLPKSLVDALAPLVAEQDKIVSHLRTESRLAMAMRDGTWVDESVFNRGSYKTPGPVVPRRFLQALPGTEPLRVARGSGRLALARQLTAP